MRFGPEGVDAGVVAEASEEREYVAVARPRRVALVVGERRQENARPTAVDVHSANRVVRAPDDCGISDATSLAEIGRMLGPRCGCGHRDRDEHDGETRLHLPRLITRGTR